MAPKRLRQDRPPLEYLPSISCSEEEDEQFSGKEEENPDHAPSRGAPVSETSEEEEEEEEEDEQFSGKEEEENPDKPPSRGAPVSETSEEEEEEQEQENTTKPSLPKPTPKTTSAPATKTLRDSDPGSDLEIHSGDTHLSPTASRFTIKPKVVSLKSKKPTSKSSDAAAKRPIAEIIEKNADESLKRKRTTVEEEEKPNRLVWSEADEIAILEGMINYRSKKGTDPYAEIGKFRKFIKHSLSIAVSKVKFVNKVRKMKVKYNKNVEKGVGAVFSKTHDLKCFELSKKIWGGGGGGGAKEKRNAVDGNGKHRSMRGRKTENGKEEVGLVAGLKAEMKEVIEVDSVGHFWATKQSLGGYPFDLSIKEPVKSFMLENMSMIGHVKAKELEKKWKDLVADEVALYLKRVELIMEQTKLTVDAMKASKNWEF